MPYAIQIFGETLVKVKGNPFSDIGELSELGLAREEITVTPRYQHVDVHADDFGLQIPAETLVHLAEVRVDMTLVYWDPVILSACLAESLGGGVEGIMGPAGQPMGGGAPRLSVGNHYIGLNLISPLSVTGLRQVAPFNYRFLTAYLAESPVVVPVGTKRSEVQLHWRAIPYVFPPTTEQRQMIRVDTNGVLTGYLDEGLITQDQLDLFAAQIAENGFAMVPVGDAETIPGEVVSNGAVLYDFQVDT